MTECILASSVLILAVLLLRFFAKGRISPRLQYALWIPVAVRLLLPFSLPASPFSVLNALPSAAVQGAAQYVSLEENPVYVSENREEPSSGITAASSGGIPGDHKPSVLPEALPFAIWSAGFGITALYFGMINFRFARRLKKEAVPMEAPGCPLPVYRAEGLPSPFLFGVFRPAVYLSAESFATENRLHSVLSHELVHFAHKDHWWALLRIFCLSVYWFHPLVWIAAALSRRDCELACDEGTFQRIGEDRRLEYGRMLISMTASGRDPDAWRRCATTICAGKAGIRERIQWITQKPKKSAALLAAVLLTVLAAVGCTFTGASGGAQESAVPSAGGADPADLDACVSTAVLSENAAHFEQGGFAAEAHTVFKTAEKNGDTVVYAMALYLVFDYEDGGFSDTAGCHGPVAITFAKNAAGEYELKEYWTPQDGSGYAPSIRERFPAEIWEDALDTQKYILAHTQACYEKAAEYGDIDTGARIETLLDIICSSPSLSSNSGDYIDAHPVEYRELLYFGSYTLRYVFGEFLKGGQTDLRSHIMLSAMRELLGDEDRDLQAGTPQGWFDAYLQAAVQERDKRSDPYLADDQPRAFLLLQMAEEAGVISAP